MSALITLYTVTVLILIGLVGAFFYLLHYFLKQHWWNTKVIIPRTKDWVFLDIQMPKDNAGDSEKQKNSDDERKKQIGIAEQLFTTLSGIGHDKGFFEAKD